MVSDPLDGGGIAIECPATQENKSRVLGSDKGGSRVSNAKAVEKAASSRILSRRGQCAGIDLISACTHLNRHPRARPHHNPPPPLRLSALKVALSFAETQ